MILSEYVPIIASNQNIKYYESLGYIISKYLDNRFKARIKRNTIIQVKVKDLLPNSRSKVLCQCENCGKQRLITYQKASKKEKHLCNLCSHNTKEFKIKHSNSHKGIIFSDERKRKISENNWMRGKIGKNAPNWNHTLTEEDRRKRHSISGITNWKKLIFKRDNYKCQCCKNTKHLCAHHLNNFRDFKEQRLDINNGITLCKNCHKLIHKIFGQKTVKENYDKFLIYYKSFKLPVIKSIFSDESGPIATQVNVGSLNSVNPESFIKEQTIPASLALL